MALLDGLCATRSIRALEKKLGQSPVPIIALTANAMQEDRDLCLQSGMAGFLNEPVRKEELLEILVLCDQLPSQHRAEDAFGTASPLGHPAKSHSTA